MYIQTQNDDESERGGWLTEWERVCAKEKKDGKTFVVTPQGRYAYLRQFTPPLPPVSLSSSASAMPSRYYTPTPLFTADGSFVNNISVDRTAVALDPIADVTADAPVGLIRQ
jgi:hypothetical protein